MSKSPVAPPPSRPRAGRHRLAHGWHLLTSRRCIRRRVADAPVAAPRCQEQVRKIQHADAWNRCHRWRRQAVRAASRTQATASRVSLQRSTRLDVASLTPVRNTVSLRLPAVCRILQISGVDRDNGWGGLKDRFAQLAAAWGGSADPAWHRDSTAWRKFGKKRQMDWLLDWLALAVYIPS